MSPVSVKKLRSGKYRVRTPGRVHAKATTKAKAMKQKRLLRAVEHTSWRPTRSK